MKVERPLPPSSAMREPDESERPGLRLRLRIDERSPQTGARLLLEAIRPRWRAHRVRFKTFTDGITNKLIGCFYKEDDGQESGDVVLIRIYGNKTDLLIDRKAELRNIKLLHKVGLAPQLYAVFDNGLAYEYVSGVTLTVGSVLLPQVWQSVARRMAEMHKVPLGPEVPFETVLWSKSEKFFNLIPDPFTDEAMQIRFEKMKYPLNQLRKELQYLKSHLISLDSPVVFAHNDLLLGNIIYDEDKKEVTFIDYEYADYNYRAYDIGNHFNEFVGVFDVDYSRYPGKEFQIPWLTEYLKTYYNRDPSAFEVEKLYVEVNKFVLASHFFWGFWALIQAEYSNIDFDFLDYANIRFTEYYDKKDIILSMKTWS